MRAVLPFLALVAALGSSNSNAETIDERRPYIARDVCTGLAAKWANANGGQVTFEAGKFRVEGDATSVTIFDQNVPLAEIPGFDYRDFNQCLTHILDGFERKQAAQERKLKVEAFNAGVELATQLSVGRCLRSAAQGGFYFGNMEQNGTPINSETMSNLAEAVSKSVSRRLKRVSGEDIEIDIAGRMGFYRFWQGREVPYFDQSSQIQVESEASGVIPGDYADYWFGGEVAGRMAVAFTYEVMLQQIVKSTWGQGDPRSLRAQQFFPPSVKCLADGYSDDERALEEFLQNVSFDDITPPTVDDAIDLSQGTAVQNLFADQVIDPIRRQLKRT